MRGYAAASIACEGPCAAPGILNGVLCLSVSRLHRVQNQSRDVPVQAGAAQLRFQASHLCIACPRHVPDSVYAAQHLPDVLIKPPPLRMDGLHVIWCRPWSKLYAPLHSARIAAADLRCRTGSRGPICGGTVLVLAACTAAAAPGAGALHPTWFTVAPGHGWCRCSACRTRNWCTPRAWTR